MAKSRARKIREKRMREGKRNPANNRGAYVFADMQTRKTKTKNEIMYQDKYGELPKVDRNETDGSSIFVKEEFSLYYFSRLIPYPKTKRSRPTPQLP